MTLTLPTAGTRPTLATLVNSHVRSAGHYGQETGSGDRTRALDVDLDRLIGALRLERRAAEAVAARLHILALAVGGAYPVSVDAADLGLCDAIDQLRQCDLLRAVLMTDALGSTESPAGDAGHRSFDRQHDEHDEHDEHEEHDEHIRGTNHNEGATGIDKHRAPGRIKHGTVEYLESRTNNHDDSETVGTAAPHDRYNGEAKAEKGSPDSEAPKVSYLPR